MSSSSNEPGSSSLWTRSRAVSLPFSCCFSTASAEAEWTAWSRSSRRWASFSSWVSGNFWRTARRFYARSSRAARAAITRASSSVPAARRSSSTAACRRASAEALSKLLRRGGHDRVEGTGNAHDPRLDRDPLAGQPLRPAAVEALPSRPDPLARLLGDAGATRQLGAACEPRVEQFPFLGGQLARRLRQYLARHVDHADLVQPGRLANRLCALPLQAQLDRRGEGVGGGPVGVIAPAGPVTLERIEERRAPGPDQGRARPVLGGRWSVSLG